MPYASHTGAARGRDDMTSLYLFRSLAPPKRILALSSTLRNALVAVVVAVVVAAAAAANAVAVAVAIVAAVGLIM